MEKMFLMAGSVPVSRFLTVKKLSAYAFVFTEKIFSMAGSVPVPGFEMEKLSANKEGSVGVALATLHEKKSKWLFLSLCPEFTAFGAAHKGRLVRSCNSFAITLATKVCATSLNRNN